MRERVLLRSAAVTDARRGQFTQRADVQLPQTGAAGRVAVPRRSGGRPEARGGPQRRSGTALSQRRGVRSGAGVGLREKQRKASTRAVARALLQVDAGFAAGTHAYAEAARLRPRRPERRARAGDGAVEGGRRNVLQLQDRLTDLHGIALEKTQTQKP